MDGMNRVIIVGAGIAGASAAEAIRKLDRDVEIILLSDELEMPYYRLSLTRYISGELKRENLFLHPEKWYQDNRIDLRVGAAVLRVNVAEQYVELLDGSKIKWNRLILSVGASPFFPPIPGKEKNGIMAVRTLADADVLLQRLHGRESCICIGGGVLGLEVAEAIARRGVKVKLFEVAPWLMPRQLNPKAAAFLRKQVESLGIQVTEGALIREFVGNDACEGIRLADGELVKSDLVIVTAGIKPETQLARDAGISVTKGIVADDRMASSANGVLTAGDCAEHDGVLYGLWNAAQLQGRIAGENVAGVAARFEGIPLSVVLKVIGIDLFSIGEFMPKGDACKTFELEQEGKYYLFVTRDGHLAGSIIVGDRAMANRVKAAVDKHQSFPADDYGNVERFLKHFTQTV